jgi:hypothetical protein
MCSTWEAQALREDIRLGRKGMPRKNTFAYYENSQI